MTPALLHRFQQLVSARTGLHIRPREREAFETSLNARLKALRLRGAEEYYRLLESGTAGAEQEWSELASRLTNRESYFFRDKGQMALLRERILPELIARNSDRRSLRLWSAGCSTGEEAYSLAILVEGLLPRPEGWELLILGTDLNPKSLAQAKRGVYGPWSFRMVEPALRERHFRRALDGWEIAASVRRMVTFAPSNLARDPFPDRSAGLYDMDLILCRNVFIYFEREAVPAVVSKFSRTLREGGYLITGHGEIPAPFSGGLKPRTFPGSLAHQRTDDTATGSHGCPPTPASPVLFSGVPEAAAPSRSVRDPPAAERPPVEHRAFRVEETEEPRAAAPPLPVLPDLELAETLYAQGDHGAVIAHLEPLLRQRPDDYRLLCLLARAYVQRGQLAEAVSMCRRASELDPLAATPYQLLAALAEDRGDYEEAKRLLKNVIYLSPVYAAAYVELGALYARDGERDRARTMWATALELLRQLPPETPLEPWNAAPAGEWIRHVEAQLAEGD
jgi:chemotaxis protein methyltransferase CheR